MIKPTTELNAMDEIINGESVPYIHQSVDGWQAYCAGRTQRSNPYKRKPDSEEFKAWKKAYEDAKDADERGMMGGDYKVMPIAAYWNRHPKNKPDSIKDWNDGYEPWVDDNTSE